MKKVRLAVMLLIGFLCMPAVARADFFNDGRWYMDSSQWELIVADPENRTNLIDQNNRLEWITQPGWAHSYEPMRSYTSKWAFDLNYDFEFNVGFYYGHLAAQYPNDYGTVVTGLFFGVPLQPDTYAFATGASSDVDYNNNPVRKFWSSNMVPGEAPAEYSWDRSNDSGIFYAYYNSLNDELQFSAEGGMATYTGLRNSLGLTQLGVLFAGDSDGASLASGDAYLENFNLVRGTMTPEPVSCALFLLGGGAMALVRRKKK